MITNERLERINRERRRKNLRPLTLAQASSVEYHNYSRTGSSNDMDTFLMGYVTGAILGPESAVGAALHNAEVAASISSDPSPSPPTDSSPSSDSGSSSIDTGSSGGTEP